MSDALTQQLEHVQSLLSEGYVDEAKEWLRRTLDELASQPVGEMDREQTLAEVESLQQQREHILAELESLQRRSRRTRLLIVIALVLGALSLAGSLTCFVVAGLP